MSKGLEALDITKDQLDGLLPKGLTSSMKWNIKTIEKELRALEIIKYKQVNYRTLLCIFNTSDNYKDYNKLYPRNKLTQEEYDLMKEVLL